MGSCDPWGSPRLGPQGLRPHCLTSGLGQPPHLPTLPSSCPLSLTAREHPAHWCPGAATPTVVPGGAGPAPMEAAALYAASGRLVDVHRVLHDDRHLGLQLRIPDTLFEEPCSHSSTATSLPGCPSPSQDPGGLQREIPRPHPLEDQSHLLKGEETQASLPPPQIQEPKAATPRARPKAGRLEQKLHPRWPGLPCRALGLGWYRGQGLLFRWLTSARILSSFSLFRTLELSPCSRLRKAPSASRRRLSRSMRTFTSA